MKAAILRRIGDLPTYDDFAEPELRDGEVLIAVRAASLKNIDRMRASGAHYDEMGTLPAICGVDGVGTLPDGRRVYFGAARSPYGTMAERTVVNPAWSFPLPPELDDVQGAAIPNPAMAAWLALTWRGQIAPGASVLVLGATGVSGQLAVQLARWHGATRVVAAGRNQAVLQSLAERGADATIAIDQPRDALVAAFAAEMARQPFDIVLDYLWGAPAEAVIAAATGDDLTGERKPTRFIQIGEMAGATINLPAAALRSSALELYGSGGGGIPHRVLGEALGQVLALAARGEIRVETEAVPLAEVASAWTRRETDGKRLVLVP